MKTACVRFIPMTMGKNGVENVQPRNRFARAACCCLIWVLSLHACVLATLTVSTFEDGLYAASQRSGPMVAQIFPVAVAGVDNSFLSVSNDTPVGSRPFNTLTSSQSGTWSSASTWGGVGVPACGDTVIIANGHTVALTADTGGAGCNLNITINNGGTLDLAGFELNYSGNNTTFTNNGTFTNTTPPIRRLFSNNGGANFTFAGNGVYAGNIKLENVNANWHIAPGTTFTFTTATNNVNLQIDASSNLDLANPLTIVGPTSGANYVVVQNDTQEMNGTGGLKTQGNVKLMANTNYKTPVEIVSGNARAEGGVLRSGLKIDTGASLTLTGELSVSDQNTAGTGMTIANGAVVDLAGNQLNIMFNGFFTNNGTVNNTGLFSRIRFADNGTHALSGTGIYGYAAGIWIFNNTTNLQPGSSLQFGTFSNRPLDPEQGTLRPFTIGVPTNIQVDAGANLNWTGPGNLTLSGFVSNAGAIRFNQGGPACDTPTRITIRSNPSGTQLQWNGAGSYVMNNLDVKDQAGTSAITTTGSINAGNNGANWVFSSPCVVSNLRGDVAPRTNGDGKVQSDDVVQVQRFQIGLDSIVQGSNEFLRADSAPILTHGDGFIQSDDVVQTQRYQIGLDPPQFIGAQRPADQASLLLSSGAWAGTWSKPQPPGNTRTLRIRTDLDPRGAGISADIIVDAVGDESAYGFTIEYDPSKLTKPFAYRGDGGGIALCAIARPGQITCSITGFPEDQSGTTSDQIGEIGAGPERMLVRLVFASSGDSKMVAPLTLVGADASDDAARALQIAW